MKNAFFWLPLFLLGFSLAAQTPFQVKVINQGAESRPERLTDFNGKLIFRARTAAQGVEPWISDGTEAGTFLLRDINDNPAVSTGNSNPDNFTVYKGAVYFKARDASNGDELWVTDGTTAGTKMVKNIHPTANGNPIDIVIYKNLLFFTATDNTSSSELWVSDGTEAGTRLFLDINPGTAVGNPGGKTVIGDFMYFSASNGANGNEIWRTDGTVAGTKMVKDIRTGTGNSLPSRFFGFKNQVFFRASDGTTGTELWKTDGTEAGTVLVKDINPGAGNSSPDNFYIADGRLFFTATDAANGTEIWTTDGTAAGTVLYADLNPKGSSNPSNFTEVVPGIQLLTANDSIIGNEPYLLINLNGFSDTALIQDINPGPAGSDAGFFVNNGHVMYFSATTAKLGTELYAYPLGAGIDTVQLISDINPGTGDAKVQELVRSGKFIFFRANNGKDSLQLWAVEARTAELQLREMDKNLSPGDTLRFGNVEVGKTASRTLRLINTGNAPLVIFDDGSSSLNAFYATLANDILQGGDSTTIRIEFTPLKTGPATELLSIISFSASNKSYPIVLQGTGIVTVAAPAIGVSANGATVANGTALSFGTVQVGKDTTRTISIRNTGNAALAISNVQTTGAQFAVGMVPASIAPDSSVNVTVKYTPSGAGAHTGSLSFTTNVPGAATFAINFNGTGSPATQVVEPHVFGVEVFPNPAAEDLFVRTNQSVRSGLATLLSADGKPLRQLPLSYQETLHIGLKGLPAGIYLLRLQDETRSAFVKILKK
ncbi:MAG: ELWxxDGT repeat protein [Saprospiraceae bacterium]|jgi:ELWxxDGT repeat protein